MSELEHYASEIYALEERIERLSIASGIDPTQLQRVRTLTEKRSNLGNGDGRTLRLLRELLVMREYIEAHCDNEYGMDECRRIIEKVNDLLLKNGHRLRNATSEPDPDGIP